MIDLTSLKMQPEPFPFGLAAPALAESVYAAMVATFPTDDFIYLKGGYDKLSLSERNNPKGYLRFVGASPLWTAFYRYVKKDLIKSFPLPLPSGPLTARFEFSALPANGGFILPHTDIPSKFVTLVIPMVRPGEWRSEWGGGTDILRPKVAEHVYADYRSPRGFFDTVASVPFEPNQALVFCKTADSWHSVGPIQGPVGMVRRSLTVNIERA